MGFTSLPKKKSAKVAVLGAGLAGCCAALKLAQQGIKVTLFDRLALPINAASLHNEGKLHLGYVYALDKDAKTHLKMIEGSLQFLGIIEGLTGIDKSNFTLSSPFNYAIPRTTMLSIDKVVDHFINVDKDIKNFLSEKNEFVSHVPKGSSNIIQEPQAKDRFDQSMIQGVIETQEIAVNPIEVANIVGASVLSNDNIEFKGNCEINEVSNGIDNQYLVSYTLNDNLVKDKFDAGINSLWEDRIRLDKNLGIHPPYSNITRYKATLTFFDKSLDFKDVPSSTFIVGSYGDVVNYKNGLYYLSWYPECKVGEAVDDNLESLKSKVAALNHKELIISCINELTTFLPSIDKFKKIAQKGKVGGGFICGWGKTDIDDFNSGLHSRSDIGVEIHKNWFSINTGKYCTAPLFGLQAAKMLIEKL